MSDIVEIWRGRLRHMSRHDPLGSRVDIQLVVEVDVETLINKFYFHPANEWAIEAAADGEEGVEVYRFGDAIKFKLGLERPRRTIMRVVGDAIYHDPE